MLSPCQTSASELARRAAVASPSRASVRSRSTSAARRLRAMRSASRSLVSHPSGTASASESVSSAQHRSTARLALSRLAARLARVRQHARIATFSSTVAVPLPLAVPIAAGASPAATRRMSLATYARTLVTARTRSVAASSRGRACVRRDAVCFAMSRRRPVALFAFCPEHGSVEGREYFDTSAAASAATAFFTAVSRRCLQLDKCGSLVINMCARAPRTI